jgi:mRNA-degrading endonuclease RelE of RelBE toxin-antitoxin system
MDYRLLVDLEVIDALDELPRKTQLLIKNRLRKMRRYPDLCSDFQGSVPNGPLLDVTIVAGYALSYWIDFADRHVKVLKIQSADD